MVVNRSNYNCNGIVVAGCKFNGILKFIGVDFGKKVQFRDCTFKKEVLFTDCIVRNEDGEVEFGTIEFINCTLEASFSITGTGISFIDGYISIENSKVGNVKINSVKSSHGGLNIVSTEISGSVDLSGNIFKEAITLKKSNINGELIIYNKSASKILFERSHCYGRVDISSYTIDLLIKDSSFYEDVNIDAIEPGILSFFGNQFDKFFHISFSQEENGVIVDGIKKICIGACLLKNGLQVTGDLFNHGRVKIDHFSIDFSNRFSGSVIVDSFFIKEIKISGSNTNSSLTFKNVINKSLDLDNFSNYSNIQFINFKSDHSAQSMLFIHSSYLGKTQFLNVDLDSFKTVRIIDSYLSEIITSNVKWFNDEQLMWVDEENIIVLKKELYRQLKVAVNKHGSQSDYLLFKQIEMNYYQQELMLSKGFWNLDTFILLTNKTNDHGLNWWRPVWLGILVTGLFYIAIIVSASNEYHFSFTCNPKAIGRALGFLWNELGVFFQLFNPARNLGAIFKDKPGFTLTGFTHFLDLFQRILISYFIFQAVSAFRKYSKA